MYKVYWTSKGGPWKVSSAGRLATLEEAQAKAAFYEEDGLITKIKEVN